jgi:hypothetical protein
MRQKSVYSLLIDRSGSMADLRDEIFQSINARIDSIQKLAAETDNDVLVEIVTFNHSIKLVLPLTEAKKLNHLNESDYQIDGTTALYDALGSTIERMNLLFGKEIEAKTCNATVVVYTDGYENASRNFFKGLIKAMLLIANKTENVQVALVGCDEETLFMAHELNFKMQNVVRTSKSDMAKSMSSLDTFFEKRNNGERTNFKVDFSQFDLDKK